MVESVVAQSGTSTSYSITTTYPIELLDHPITKKVLNDKIPSPEDDVKPTLGSDDIILKSFYLPLALLSKVARRDGDKPYFLHPFSVAFKPKYRFDDKNLPSRYIHTTYEECLGLIHDLEMFSRSLEGFEVLLYALTPQLGTQLGEGLDELTNRNEWAMKPVTKYLDRMKEKNIERYKRLKASDISERLERILNDFHSKGAVRQYKTFIDKQYKRIIGVLEEFVSNMMDYHDELTTNDKNFIREILTDSFTNPIRQRFGAGDIFEPRQLITALEGRYNKLMQIVNGTDYDEADPKLVHPKESRYLETLEKTLYRDFIENAIIRKAERRYENGSTLDDTFLSNPIVKVSDITANVSTLDYDIMHIISQFRKSRQVHESGNGLITILSDKGAEPELFERFEAALDYSRRHLLSSLRERYKTRYKDFKSDDSYGVDVRLLSYMLSKEGVDPKKVLKEGKGLFGLGRVIGFL